MSDMKLPPEATERRSNALTVDMQSSSLSTLSSPVLIPTL
jgi:hypothetical protein